MVLSLMCLDACAAAGTNNLPEAAALKADPGTPTKAEPVAPTKTIEGRASFYGGERNGKLTSSGAVFNTLQMTAAHRSLPFGTKVAITNLLNKRTCNVEITDRGPARWTGRVIDVSEEAARCLEMIRWGVVPVTLQYAG